MAIYCRHHEMDEPMEESSDSENAAWLHENLNSMQIKRSEMNALIMDYLVHEGFKEAAERFREEANVDPSCLRLDASGSLDPTLIKEEAGEKNATNHTSANNSTNSKSTNTELTKNGHLSAAQQNNHDAILHNHLNHNSTRPNYETAEMIDKRIEVREVIQDGDILKAKTLINMYYPELLDNHRELYFKLQQQHVIELIRSQKINEVLSYVHEHISVSDSLPLNEIERTIALLAYDDPDTSPYSDLLAPAHRLQLASEINDVILKETTGNVETPKPRLVTLLKLVYWTQSELEQKNIQFPKMSDLFGGSINFGIGSGPSGTSRSRSRNTLGKHVSFDDGSKH